MNASESAIYYKPQDLAVRLEDRIYTQSLADASGIMPPKSTTPAFFAITGNGQGGRGNLAPDNKWNVLVAGHQPRKLLHLGRQFHRHHCTQIQTSNRP